MTTTDWIIDIVLVLIVLRQIRRAPINWHFVLLPAGIVAYVAHAYLHGLPTSGNALLLTVVALLLGSTLGIVGGLVTRVGSQDGQAWAQAGVAAASIWIASMTARLGFIIWITHQPGQAELVRFSMAHGITDPSAWQTALVLLALSEVTTRIALIVYRGRRAIAAERREQPVRDLVTA